MVRFIRLPSVGYTVGIIDSFRLDGKVSIVTGCSSGIGPTLASGLAEAGSDLVVCARRKEKLEANADEIAKRTGKRVVPIAADVSREPDVKHLVDQTVKEFGKLDVLVNNAGVSFLRPAEEMTGEEWLSVNRVNLDGVFYCSRDAAQIMKKNGGGSIINIASSYGFSADILFPIVAYHASKAAVINMTRALAVEWARFGIRVNGIAPGWVRTEMTQITLGDQKKRDYILQHTPMGRVGEADELNGALVLLASDAGRFLTGTTISVDGGWTAV
jgi:NAD(P)-dependent dehydrogenase (short-subunit alcohol dehydrogenase family)